MRRSREMKLPPDTVAKLAVYIIIIISFTTQVVEARGEEREKKVKYIDCADGLKA